MVAKPEIIENCGKGVFLVRFLKVYYEKEAVFAAAEMFTVDYYIKIDSLEDYVCVYFSSKDESGDAQTAILSFCNETIDQQTKLDLNKQFGNLRESIYKLAFEPIS